MSNKKKKSNGRQDGGFMFLKKQDRGGKVIK